MDGLPVSRTPTPRLRLVQSEELLDQATVDALKVNLTQDRVEIRKSRFRRQGYVPPGLTWHGILLTDGVDRAIAQELQLPFETQELNLANGDEAQLWVLERVLENPQLNAFQRIRAALRRKELLLAIGRKRMSASGEGLTEMSKLPSHNTRAQVARESRTSEGQVQKVEHLLELAPADVLQELEAGEIKIGRAFEMLRSRRPADASPATRYGALYLDPPTGIVPKQLRSLPVASLAAEDAALFLWSRPCDLAIRISFLRKWGFAYQTHFVFPLPRALARDFSQETHEILLLATRGRMPTPAIEDLPATLMAVTPDTDRSVAVFDLIEKLVAAEPS